jgi:hypothetical protein
MYYSLYSTIILPTRQSNDGFSIGINIVREFNTPLDPRLASNNILTLNSFLFSIEFFMVFICNYCQYESKYDCEN